MIFVIFLYFAQITSIVNYFQKQHSKDQLSFIFLEIGVSLNSLKEQSSYFVVLKYFWRHCKSAPLRDENVRCIFTTRNSQCDCMGYELLSWRTDNFIISKQNLLRSLKTGLRFRIMNIRPKRFFLTLAISCLFDHDV